MQPPDVMIASWPTALIKHLEALHVTSHLGPRKILPLSTQGAYTQALSLFNALFSAKHCSAPLVLAEPCRLDSSRDGLLKDEQSRRSGKGLSIKYYSLETLV